jgi:hypothetical protein
MTCVVAPPLLLLLLQQPQAVPLLLSRTPMALVLQAAANQSCTSALPKSPCCWQLQQHLPSAVHAASAPMRGTNQPFKLELQQTDQQAAQLHPLLLLLLLAGCYCRPSTVQQLVPQ